MNTQTINNKHVNVSNEDDACCGCCPPARPRIGKIACLPDEIREHLNLLLAEGEQGESVLRWVNALPETKRLLKREFDGKPINKQNLSDWRKGGHAEWLLRQDLMEQAENLRHHARQLREDTCYTMADDLVTVFTARYAALLNRWDGEVSEAFSDKVRVFSRIRRDLLRLQECAHETVLWNREEDKIDMEERRRIEEEATDWALAPIKAAQRREYFKTAYGPEAGHHYANLLDSLHYAKHPLYPSHFIDPDDDAQENKTDVAQEPEQGAETQQGAVPSEKSQAKAKPAQAVADETTQPKTTLPESSPVKPFSEEGKSTANSPGENAGNGETKMN